MAGIILNSELHSIAQYLVKLEDFVKSEYSGVVDIDSEIQKLNNEYGFKPADEYTDFYHDVHKMYAFERDRKLDSINPISFAKF